MIAHLALLAGAALAGTRGVHTDSPRPPDLEQAYAPRRVALVVGIDRYTDPALGDLRYSAKDAQDLAAALSSPGEGSFDLVSQVAGTVTKQSFWSAFEAATGHLQRDDTFVLFIAGHGTLDLGGEGTLLYVMPSDSWLEQPADTGIPLLDLEEAFSHLPARRRVLLLDTCYSGSGRSALTPAMKARLDGLRGPLPAPLALDVSEQEVRLFSAHHNQPAIEDEHLANGVYTHFFVEALGGAGDADGDGLVDVL
ncbi:MAG: caspase family protein, partial [Pseudomonadota bacterium]